MLHIKINFRFICYRIKKKIFFITLCYLLLNNEYFQDDIDNGLIEQLYQFEFPSGSVHLATILLHMTNNFTND